MVAPLKVGIAGLGTVGAEVVRGIEQQGRILTARCGRGVRIVAVTARSRTRKRGVDLDGIAWAKSPLAVATDPDVDCFVELIGGDGDPALSAIEAALAAGKSVVTANKALIARHGLRLAKLAEQHGGALNYEAAVGAAIPIVKTLREGLAGTEIKRVYGILNGTCNYILTRMEQEGLSFAECLKDAQRLGYAEANPTFDVDGHDTAQKLAILASQNNWQGIVVYGCIRDADDIGEIELGVRALDTHPLKSIKKGIGERDLPVSFGGVTFRPGEWIYVDGDGLVVSDQPLT